MRDEDFFSAGVGPGGLNSREQIRLLLCYLALRLPEPMTLRQAEQVLTQEGLANYFEFRAAMEKLLTQGHLTAEEAPGGMRLRLPEEYRRAAAELAKELPSHIRDRALHCAQTIQESERRERDENVSVCPLEGGGFYVTFRQGEGSDMLMSITVYLANRAQVEEVKARFVAQPGRLYAAVLAALTEGST
ncbi:MAG: DUF4364 family protein [Oscillospiraceae bacterium]|jgi:hypothetical protein|nr:DUF4364 family protein [Oscillospiraceae bacterium]